MYEFQQRYRNTKQTRIGPIAMRRRSQTVWIKINDYDMIIILMFGFRETWRREGH